MLKIRFGGGLRRRVSWDGTSFILLWSARDYTRGSVYDCAEDKCRVKSLICGCDGHAASGLKSGASVLLGGI